MIRADPTMEPYDCGLLDVGDGNHVYWEICGNPRGKPALVVHGGPGSGCTPASRAIIDPTRYKVVLFDQRGCGRSRPHASDPAVDMSVNTTHHLIADMEKLRVHLGLSRWLLFGGSWGSTLVLAYTQKHPDRVSDIVIRSVTMTRRSEIDWLYRGVGRFFPDAWAQFRAVAGDDDVVAAYARMMSSRDPAVRERAVHAWIAWEDTVVSLEPQGKPSPYSRRAADARTALVRICTHYFANGAWLEEGALLQNAGRLAGIPGVLIHGRLDLGGPLQTAWELAQAWPDATLVTIDDAGHTGSDRMRDAVQQALDRFAPFEGA